MSLRSLVAKTLLITPSGALSPGPLSAVGVAVGASLGPAGGLLVALGHMIAELPYVYVLVRFIEAVMRWLDKWRRPLVAVVTVFLLYFSYLLARDAYTLYTSGALEVEAGTRTFTPLQAILAGIVLTALNPYFLAWWATVGYPLVEGAARHGARGFTVMYASHVWMDYAWLGLLAWGGGAARVLGVRPYAVLLGLLAVVLAVFAAMMIVGEARGGRLGDSLEEG
ncbi:MAG: LysE family transporter [Desulfurococcales archaeon]|nr:LysE family transporter [Desulfurococcales archaeon]